MRDITICINKKCGKINYCWRLNAPPKDFQSYAMFEPNPEENICDFFLSMEDKSLIELMEGEEFP